MATKTTPKKTTTTTRAAVKSAAVKKAKVPAPDIAIASGATGKLAALLARCPEAVEVKVAEEDGIAVRLKTEQIEIPLLVHVGELVVFDAYPFRFVGVDAEKVDWVRILRLCRTGYVQLGLDQDFEDEDVVVYSFPMPLQVLDEAMVKTVVGTLAAFASDNYDDVMEATGLVEKKKITKPPR
ncbi:MAG: hypothetical protein Q8O67_28610 [Deltaproteobacteria bacterium]|nr:hypothetical protein [Deltaproteobacteria bacterium]